MKHIWTRLFTIAFLLILVTTGTFNSTDKSRAAQSGENIPDSGITERVSISSDGTQANGISTSPFFSSSGRYVVFASAASNLVTGDTNGSADIYMHDKQTGETTRVSVASDGTQGNNPSYQPSVSSDGRFVAFWSEATNLVSNDTNSARDVFVHDRQTRQTILVSINSAGIQGDGNSMDSSISSNGRYVAFTSWATNLVSADTNGLTDVFVHDIQTGDTVRVSVASDGTQGNGFSEQPALSSDGGWVVFSSTASTLVNQDNNNAEDVFLHNLQTGETMLVSIASDGTQGNSVSWYPSVSQDGRYVAFSSSASNLVSNDTNYVQDVFLHDQQTGETMRVSKASNGTQGDDDSNIPSISSDGRYISFESWAINLVSWDTNAAPDVFVHDLQTGETTRVSVASDGSQTWDSCSSSGSSISGDGRYIAFQSNAPNLVGGDTNGVTDIFVHDRGSGLSLSGRVMDSTNNPVPGVTVSTDTGSHATSQTNGYFIITNLITGTYTITPAKPGYTFSPPSRPASVPPSQSGLDFTGESQPSPYTIQPIWPVTHTVNSTAMAGGTLYRHFRIVDETDNPVPGAEISFSLGGLAISDPSGYFTYTLSADTAGTVGSLTTVNVHSIMTGGQTYSTFDQPSFKVAVQERRYAHRWGYGASTRGKGGTAAGVIAYLYSENSGGMQLELEESDPDLTTDDMVSMEENYDQVAGAGAGVGIETGISVGIIASTLSAEATTGLALRNMGHLTAQFPDPYQPDDQKGQAIYLLVSVADSLNNTFPGSPFSSMILSQALKQGAPYQGYITEDQAGNGLQVTPLQANIGATVDLAFKQGNVGAKSRLLGFDLLDVGLSVMSLSTFTDYPALNEIGLGNEAGYDLDFSLLSVQVGPFKNKLLGTIGQISKSVKMEIVLDASTNAVKRMELSLIGEGNPLAYTDSVKESVTVKIIIPADQLTPQVLDQAVNIARLIQAAQDHPGQAISIGPTAMVTELNALLSAISYAEYEIVVEDGAETNLEPILKIAAGIDLELGAGLSIQKSRSLVRERGVFLNSHMLITEAYDADTLVAEPGKTWQDLSLNALHGLWELVKDAFGWLVKLIESGLQWTVDIISRNQDGDIWGGAQLTAPAGNQLYNSTYLSSEVPLQPTESITLTAMSWVPTNTLSLDNLIFSPASETALGQGFVVGGIYSFQPYTLTISPAATLVITYTDPAVAGIDENRLGMFRWNPADHNWMPLEAISNTLTNSFTASVSQLGTFALGYDDTLPDIQLIAPADGSLIHNALPLINAIVTDTGTGIDPDSVQMQVDGQVVVAEFIPATGYLAYIPIAPLANGLHSVSITATDVLGNRLTLSTTFRVETFYKTFLPTILK